MYRTSSSASSNGSGYTTCKHPVKQTSDSTSRMPARISWDPLDLHRQKREIFATSDGQVLAPGGRSVASEPAEAGKISSRACRISVGRASVTPEEKSLRTRPEYLNMFD
ncbi:hypothetical protein WA026_018477 [Henosepilachna vigintioctopunctata]|uniref:Uncharacterized protein n=1 Tax=Henosepilachna vigintioctopunctata TaxID=420089 RepID=A0AAW1UWG2_9CUCU